MTRQFKGDMSSTLTFELPWILREDYKMTQFFLLFNSLNTESAPMYHKIKANYILDKTESN